MANTMERKASLTTASVVCLLVVFACSFVRADNDDHGDSVISLDNADTFAASLEKNRNFVMFYAPWCGHCKNLSPTWNELAKFYNKLENGPVVIAKVDCTVEKALCADHDITGFPTLKLFELSGSSHKRYTGKRDLESLKAFVQENVPVEGEEAEEEEEDDEVEDASKPEVPEVEESLVILDDETFSSVVSEGMFFIKFYAPWCGHCKKLAPVWDDLADSFSGMNGVAIAKIDCTQNPVSCTENSVRGYPTLLFFNNGKMMNQYQGPRSHENLKRFVQEQIAAVLKTDDGEEEEIETQPEGHSSKSLEVDPGEVVELTAETFSSHLDNQLVFVKFYAPWCGHCKRLAPTWDELAKSMEEEDVSVAKVDCTQHKPVCDENKVRGYPTLKMFRDGVLVSDYKGSRTLEDLHGFIKGYLGEHDEL